MARKKNEENVEIEQTKSRQINYNDIREHIPNPGANYAEDLVGRSARNAYREISRNLARNLKELPKFENVEEAIQHAKLGVIESFQKGNMLVYIGKVKGEAIAVLLPCNSNPHGKADGELNEGDLIRIDNLKQIYQQRKDEIKVDNRELERTRQKEIEKDIEEHIEKLPNFRNLDQARANARIGIIKWFEDDGMVVYLGKVNGEKVSVWIPRRYKGEKERTTKIEGDYINIENKVPQGKLPSEVRMEKNRINEWTSIITYTNSKNEITTGRIIGHGESDRGDDVIFQSSKGIKYSIKISTLERHMMEVQHRKGERESHTIRLDGTNNMKRDGTNAAPEFNSYEPIPIDATKLIKGDTKQITNNQKSERRSHPKIPKRNIENKGAQGETLKQQNDTGDHKKKRRHRGRRNNHDNTQQKTIPFTPQPPVGTDPPTKLRIIKGRSDKIPPVSNVG